MDNEIVVRKATGLSGLGSIEDMQAKIEDMDKRRKVILNYIDSNFVKEIDYGATDERTTKPTLKKPGAEKICRLFGTHPEWKQDTETWEMLGKPEGIVCYVCYIIDNNTGCIIGEGRGAEKVGNKSRDANKTLKNAEKCALVDAALYTFMLSEKFTQDDAGRAKALGEAKELLTMEIGNNRAGLTSELTDVQFLIKILKGELHKTRIDTPGEIRHLRRVLFEEKAYDFQTGEKAQT